MSDDFDEKPSSPRGLSESEWKEAAELYALGETTINDLAERFGVSPYVVSKGFMDRGVKKGSTVSKAAEIRDKVRELVHAESMEEKNELQARIKESRDEFFKSFRTLRKLQMQLLAQRIMAKQSVALAKEEMKSIQIATSALATNRDQTWAILGLDRNDFAGSEVTPLIIREMTAEDEARVRAEARGEDDFDSAELDGLIKGMGEDDPRASET